MDPSKATTHRNFLKLLIDLTIWEVENLPTPATALGRYTFLKVVDLALKNQASLKDLHHCECFSSSGIRSIYKELQHRNLVNHYKCESDARQRNIHAEPELLKIFDQYLKKYEELRNLTSSN